MKVKGEEPMKANGKGPQLDEYQIAIEAPTVSHPGPVTSPKYMPATDVSPALSIDRLTAFATGRSSSMFLEDWTNHIDELHEKIDGRRVLVLGGAGSIGASTVYLLSSFDLACLHVVDHSENALAELVRDLRSRASGFHIKDFRALPLDFGSPVMKRHIVTEKPYDLVFNFAALKHVRSEKDVCSVLQIFETNLLKPIRCWCWLLDRGSNPSYFSVSTDKAAEPVNLMGASKRLMEHIMFCPGGPMATAARVTSARFANVAFSNGSLLESFIHRFEKRQPIAAPANTLRFFVSLAEAGQLCVLAAVCGPDRHIMIPRLNLRDHTRKLEEIAAAFLRHQGVEPRIYLESQEARQNLADDLLHRRYPLLLTPLDTQGEKECEIFAGPQEEAIECGMSNILAVRYNGIEPQCLFDFIRSIESFISYSGVMVEKRDIVSTVSRLLPEFSHMESSRTLDERM